MQKEEKQSVGTKAPKEEGNGSRAWQGCGADGGSFHLLMPSATAPLPGQEQLFQDCAEVLRAGIHTSGVYTLHIANLSQPKRVSTTQSTPTTAPTPAPPHVT